MRLGGISKHRISRILYHQEKGAEEVPQHGRKIRLAREIQITVLAGVEESHQTGFTLTVEIWDRKLESAVAIGCPVVYPLRGSSTKPKEGKEGMRPKAKEFAVII